MTLGEHPMELMRPQLQDGIATSADVAQARHGSSIAVAGMVVARQRPATAKGVVFMLLEDELGTVNLIVPPPVAERCRIAVRSAGFVIARGRLEHREGTTNVVVSSVERLEREGVPAAPPARTIAPSVERVSGSEIRESRGESGRETDPALEDAKRRGRRVRVGSRMGWEVSGELDRPAREQIVNELAAALPAPHSFGRRGR
jgi:error-prone DNA polymerase